MHFWERLEKNHPVIYEVVWWGVLALSMIACVISVVALIVSRLR